MKALILAADGFEDSELLVPMYRLLEEGWEVVVAGPGRGTISGKHGYEVEAAIALRELKSKDYDALVIPGGKAPETVRLNTRALTVVREMMAAEKPVGSICHGAQVLVSAGVMTGRKATCYIGVRDDLKIAGADYLDAEVLVDGNLVTSRCPSDLPAFCRELMKLARKA